MENPIYNLPYSSSNFHVEKSLLQTLHSIHSPQVVVSAYTRSYKITWSHTHTNVETKLEEVFTKPGER